MINKHTGILALFIILFSMSCSSSYKTYTSSMANLSNPLPECPSSPNCERITLSLDADSTSVFYAIDEVLNKMNAEKINVIGEQQINAVFKIPVFGYRDDVSVAFKSNGDSTMVFIRSASREGYWDVGVNKQRVKKIIKLTKQTLSK